MVTHGNQDTRPRRSPQGSQGPIAEANKIGAATPFDFEGKNLTAYGGLLPVATMLEKLGFQQVVEETLRVKRITRVMSLYQFVLAMVLALYVGVFPLAPFAVPGAGADAGGDLKGPALAAAVYLLAVSGLAASAGGPAVVGSAAAPAPAGVGGGPCAAEVGDPGHRHHRAHALWAADGSAREGL